MADAVDIRCFAAGQWQTYRDLRLRALADAPDAFGSTLAREQAFPDARWQARLADFDARFDLPLLASVRDRPVGLAWGRIEPDAPTVATLYQMWVAPECRGAGAGSGLLRRAVAWARERGVARVKLAVTCGDSPARRMYDRAGFVPVGSVEPLRAGTAIMAITMHLELPT